jgi:5-carboxymethyl-2-hydroxymuconate isomerase
VSAFGQCSHNYFTGLETSDFIHVTLKILSGRTVEQKQMLSTLVGDELQQLKLQGCSLTVEVMDIARESYSTLVS